MGKPTDPPLLIVLQQVCEANLKAAFDEVLRQRGIPLTVYGFQLAVTSKKGKAKAKMVAMVPSRTASG
jgi:hypothetical protein